MDTATSWKSQTAASLLSNRQLVNLSQGLRHDAFTASSAWNIILAARQRHYPRLIVPHWGLSQNIAAVEISRVANI
jgi:hypothetical protein